MDNLEITGLPENVYRAIVLWICKPSVFNKNVGSTKLICINQNQQQNPLEIVSHFFEKTTFNIEGVSSYGSVESSLKAALTASRVIVSNDLSSFNQYQGSWLVVRFLVPKNGTFSLSTINVVVCDFDCGKFEFSVFEETTLRFCDYYSICFDGVEVTFFPKQNNCPKLDRLKALFFSKLGKWGDQKLKSPAIESLSLVPQEDYFVLYNGLKRKYRESIRNIWNESTDPDKFIHEDLAIASYLILIWGRKKQKFVDLGCGNGLLVHILTEEGHEGQGIDVRPRKIWNSYPHSTVLKEATIVPSPSYVFPDVNWIIGNHSDELTPWIPIISLLSSDHTNFFLLPCCAYEFSGEKYRRANTSKSQYMDYLDYIESVCNKCGFNTYRDRLKIPSTKRICFVTKGRRRTCSKEEVKDIINEHSCDTIKSRNKNSDEVWLNEFKTRSAVEKVRNCTQLDQQFVSELLLKISSLLLSEFTSHSSSWHQGTPMEISSVAKSLPKEDLLKLKNECGGLQTFFRNHHFIFQISLGKIFFRKPEAKVVKSKSWKTKPCWFYINHPQSCPLEDKFCSFVH